MLRQWGNWLENTDASHLLQDHLWVIPTSQSIHILGVGTVFSIVVILSLRVLGIGYTRRSVQELADTLLPWMAAALIMLLITGVLQTVAEPMRQFVTPVFWLKMGLLVCGVALTWGFARSVRLRAFAWSQGEVPSGAKWFAVLSLLLWLAVIVCGRFIAYTYTFFI